MAVFQRRFGDVRDLMPASEAVLPAQAREVDPREDAMRKLRARVAQLEAAGAQREQLVAKLRAALSDCLGKLAKYEGKGRAGSTTAPSAPTRKGPPRPIVVPTMVEQKLEPAMEGEVMEQGAESIQQEQPTLIELPPDEEGASFEEMG